MKQSLASRQVRPYAIHGACSLASLIQIHHSGPAGLISCRCMLDKLGKACRSMLAQISPAWQTLLRQTACLYYAMRSKIDVRSMAVSSSERRVGLL